MEHAITGATLWGTFLRGGALMWPILACSVAGLAFVLERFISLRRSAVFPRKLEAEVGRLVREGRVEAALQACTADASAYARLMRACLLRADTPGYDMEVALEETGARVLYDLRRNGRALGIIADVAPLLGLMGTVTGMIKAFEAVAKAGALGRTELLAGGISEALLTTAFGLMVAVPVLILYQYFRAKAEGLLRTMEDTCLDIMAELRRSKAAS